jgi:2-hydroxycyclohexanecarboxyl-CoA dehydrogenase
MRLDNKVALVTGGASGIGKATVLALARAGARVFCADMNEAGGAATAAEAGGAGLKVEYLKVDVTDSASIDACAAAALQRAGGRVDVLVNAAGWGRVQPFIENPPDF